MSSESCRRQFKIQTCPFGCAVRMVLASIIILTSAIDEVHAGHSQSSGMGVSAKSSGMGVSAKPSGKGNLKITPHQMQAPGMGSSAMGGGVPMGGTPTGGTSTGGTPMSSSCVTGQLVCPIWQPLHSQCRCPDNFGNYHSGQAQ
jgi:hypothetical protein